MSCEYCGELGCDFCRPKRQCPEAGYYTRLNREETEYLRAMIERDKGEVGYPPPKQSATPRAPSCFCNLIGVGEKLDVRVVCPDCEQAFMIQAVIYNYRAVEGAEDAE